MLHLSAGWSSLTVAPVLLFLYGCGATVYSDKFDAAAVGQPPAPPAVGTSTHSGDAVVAAHPQNPSSSDRWLRLARPVPTQEGGAYVGTLTENLINTKATFTLVGYIPNSSPITMSVYFEPRAPAPPIPLLHIDLLKNHNIRLNDETVVGTFQFDTLVGFVINFDLTVTPPTVSVLVTGGGNNANTTVQVPTNAANFGLGRIRVVAPFEGVNAPAGAFLLNDVLATRPN